MRRVTVLMLTALLIAGGPLPMVQAQGNGNGGNAAAQALSIPVVGTVTGTVAGVFAGAANVTGFAVQNGQLVAVGTLVGTVTNAAGMVVQSVVATFTAPLTQQQAACNILNLVIGPIHLDLLGLVIDTNTITLNITAVPGAGNLLGNLLCAVAGLLNSNGALTQIANLLNQILAAL